MPPHLRIIQVFSFILCMFNEMKIMCIGAVIDQLVTVHNRFVVTCSTWASTYNSNERILKRSEIQTDVCFYIHCSYFLSTLWRRSQTLLFLFWPTENRDSSVEQRWATGWMMGDSSPSRWGGRGWECFSSPPRPYRLWGPTSLLYNAYQGLFPWG
jgi:hypothetical protein